MTRLRVFAALGWAALAAVLVAAMTVAALLGFFGLALFGGAVWLVCTMAMLDEQTPTWGEHVFRAHMQTPAPRQSAAMLRYYGRCGMILTAIGTAGAAWQFWRL